MKCAKDPNYQPCEDNKHEIIDGANHKPREIEKPMFCPEQILHHMIVEPFKPVLITPQFISLEKFLRNGYLSRL